MHKLLINMHSGKYRKDQPNMYKTSRHLAKKLTQERTTLKNRGRMSKIISAPSHPNEYQT